MTVLSKIVATVACASSGSCNRCNGGIFEVAALRMQGPVPNGPNGVEGEGGDDENHRYVLDFGRVYPQDQLLRQQQQQQEDEHHENPFDPEDSPWSPNEDQEPPPQGLDFGMDGPAAEWWDAHWRDYLQHLQQEQPPAANQADRVQQQVVVDQNWLNPYDDDDDHIVGGLDFGDARAGSGCGSGVTTRRGRARGRRASV